MTPLDALLIVQHYQFQSYQSAACKQVLAQARQMIIKAAEAAMKTQVGTLCTTCWGDGFHRPSADYVRGPCKVCNGTGKAALQSSEASS